MPSILGHSHAEHLQVIKGFSEKADGKDKLTALIQYLCMFISANEPGNVKKIQASVTAARKIFRIMRPLESITPLLVAPGFNSREPKTVQAINKVKALCMAAYFGADHFVWAYQIGLTSDKAAADRWQKISLWSWCAGSLLTVASESINITKKTVQRREGEAEEEYTRRVEESVRAIKQHQLVLVHAILQALLAGALLGHLPFKPRTTGLIGTIASAINCYFLMPAYPARPANAKAKAT